MYPIISTSWRGMQNVSYVPLAFPPVYQMTFLHFGINGLTKLQLLNSLKLTFHGNCKKNKRNASYEIKKILKENDTC